MNVAQLEKKMKQYRLATIIAVLVAVFILMALINLAVAIVMYLFFGLIAGLIWAVISGINASDVYDEFRRYVADLEDKSSYASQRAKKNLEDLRAKHPKLVAFFEKMASEDVKS